MDSDLANDSIAAALAGAPPGSGGESAPGASLHRRIWNVALPAILANLTTVLPGLCDTAFIGRSGDAVEQAGVALGATFAGLLLWAFGFLRMGTTGVTAQGYGARNPREVRQALYWSLALAGGFGLALVIAAIPLGAWVLPLYGGQPQAQNFAAQYFHLRMLAAPCDLALYAVMGWLIGLQRARMVFLLQLLLNAVNVALCYLFVIVFDFGVIGVAGATVLAQLLAALVAVSYAYATARRSRSPAEPRTGFNFELLARLVGVNRDIFIRTLALMLVFNYFVHLSAGMDAVTLAANQVLLGFLALIANGLDGFAQSAETLTGAALGARSLAGLAGALWGNLFWSVSLAVAIAALLWLIGPHLLPLFSSNAGVVAAASGEYDWVALSPVISVWCFLLDGVFIGATRGRELRNGMLLSSGVALIAMRLALWLHGNTGLWAAMMLFFAVRALPLAWWYRRIPASLAS